MPLPTGFTVDVPKLNTIESLHWYWENAIKNIAEMSGVKTLNTGMAEKVFWTLVSPMHPFKKPLYNWIWLSESLRENRYNLKEEGSQGNYVEYVSTVALFFQYSKFDATKPFLTCMQEAAANARYFLHILGFANVFQTYVASSLFDCVGFEGYTTPCGEFVHDANLHPYTLGDVFSYTTFLDDLRTCYLDSGMSLVEFEDRRCSWLRKAMEALENGRFFSLKSTAQDSDDIARRLIAEELYDLGVGTGV